MARMVKIASKELKRIVDMMNSPKHLGKYEDYVYITMGIRANSKNPVVIIDSINKTAPAKEKLEPYFIYNKQETIDKDPVLQHEYTDIFR